MISAAQSLKAFNTFGIDVNCKYFASFASVDVLRNLLTSDEVKNNTILILGGGSNMLFTKDFDGIVLRNELKGIELIKQDDAHYYIKAAAGEVWHEFVMYCVDHNYAGLENLSLIPGCVGASPMQNIGAYGVEIKDVFESLEALEIATGQIHHFNLNDCEFGYRESVFKRKLKNQFIITSVTFKLNKQASTNTSYGAIEQELQVMGISKPSIKDVSQAVINIRKSKLPNPAEIGNAGSFYKNPEVPASKRNALLEQFPNLVSYALPNGDYKLAAGWLIEQCGLKGYTNGNHGIHKQQALVLVNYGGATGSEVYAVSTLVIEKVKEKFGVELEREVNIY